MRIFALILFVSGLWLSACTGTPENNEGTTTPPEETMPENDMQEDTTMMDTTMMDTTGM